MFGGGGPSSSSFEAKVLMAKGKRATAAYVHADCSGATSPKHLNEVLDNLLNPAKAIDEWDTIDWCKWLMAGGRTPDEFSTTVRTYDNPTTCGLVWTPNFVAYRCRTCGISPCMSLCTECFKKGNHQRHDFNMFLSQAGGACDCGDISVMKETGFCDRHGPNKTASKGNAPRELMCVAEAMMPRIILRLIQHLRETSNAPAETRSPIQDADRFITMLIDFTNMGDLMRRVMTQALTNPQMYRVLNEVGENPDSEYGQYMAESKRIYEDALRTLPVPEGSDERGSPSFPEVLHKTFLEELVFWTVKFEFPQKVVCLLLNILPDADYKEALTKAFVIHYNRISMMLENSNDVDTLSNRVVHVSVQLFSNESLALRMTEQLNLLHIMVVSLKYMLGKILIQNVLHDPDKNFHYVVDCSRKLMKEHCYWPLVSDLNNVLSHRPVALKFLADDALVEMWFAFLSMFQGMNVNHREVHQHIEFEPNSYYAAFSAELEAAAYPMWALVSHLTDSTTAHLSRKLLTVCLNSILEWFEAINFTTSNIEDSLQMSFHLPLHRYFAVFLCQAVAKQGVSLNEVLPSSDVIHMLMMHPLRVQVAFYEIVNGLWVRNGLQIKGQSMTYIQCNFCNSMVDADLYLLQICSTRIPADTFLKILIEKFHIKEWMSLAPYQAPQNSFFDGEQDTPMLESFLTFLATLVSVRTNLGLSETALNRLEMVTLLCMGDKTHSQLMEMMPERCGTSQSRDFESLLAEVANYKPPALELCGTMQQGQYSPKSSVWDKHFDPIHVLLRAVHRREFQTSMDRYTAYAKQKNKIRSGTNPWPPFRTPNPCSEAYIDPRKILRSRVFHAVVLVVLYKAIKTHISEHVLALLIFLLEQAIKEGDPEDNSSKMCTSGLQPQRQMNDMDVANWFVSDSLSENLRTVIERVILTPEPEVTPLNYSSDSDLEWDGGSEPDAEMSDEVMAEPHGNVLMLEEAEWSHTPSSSNLMVLMPPSSNLEDVASTPGSSTQSQVLALPPPSTSTSGAAENMQVAVPGERSVVGAPSTASHSVPSFVSAITRSVRPAVLAGNEVGRTSQNWPHRSSTSKELIPSTSSSHRKSYPYRRRQNVENATVNPPTVRVDESIISLLLKLHSQLSGSLDSFHPEDVTDETLAGDENMYGDGPFYVAKLLKRIWNLDDDCKRFIQETKERLWPKLEECEENPQETKEDSVREERRRRAKERQQKLMAEFASKQKQFMEKQMEEEASATEMDWQPEGGLNVQEYDCVICNQSTPSTEDKPMGLVVLVQATSIIGHRRRQCYPERAVLPTCEEEKDGLRRDDTLITEFDRRVEQLGQHFDPQSWLLSINVGWEGGVHVQTCGHHLHLDCLKSYLHSLRSQQRQQNLSPEKGEYHCPLCRQLANSVLPLSPQLGDCTQMVRSRPTSMEQVINELSSVLGETHQKPNKSNLSEAMSRAMEDMTNNAQTKPMFKIQNPQCSNQSLFLFVTSIARTNLEIALTQRSGTLVTTGEPLNPLLPKRDCIIPLLHVLALHARVLALWPAWMNLQQLSGYPATPTNALAAVDREVPLLLRDPIALLLQFVLLLPLHVDQVYFTTIVKVVYNLLYYQAVCQISCGLTGPERLKACEGASTSHIDSLGAALLLINEVLGETDLYTITDDGAASQEPQVNVIALEQQIQKLCLPFLRVATLLRHHIYNQPLPDIRAPQSEYVRLVYYLELVTEGMDWGCFNAAVALNWSSGAPEPIHRKTPKIWCSQYAAFIAKSQIAARSFLIDQHISWHAPRLLDLPREYEKIFTYYHERPCTQCHSVPSETSVCLLCGTIVCLKQNCCKQQNVCEAVAHSLECGAGTGIFLVVTSTYIIVIRGQRACLWGSLYLDDFEEEDRDLKRGKPLYLSRDRYRLLEQQWLAHRFDHTKKTWVWHRNAL
ncbi:E3 ubiquitin-protein ligase Ubr3 [Onthophagus taurus]|uniref:E3 ubiquitin-protein ligase Ubr3 n=1 Tax=Onthophagus taurus TaxID=166361 RepID=UPI000C20031B|nr:E3 ubiquitin-protein ligase Ubr3 [Onthophagus taurus]